MSTSRLFGSPTIQTTLGPVNTMGSNSGSFGGTLSSSSVYTSNSYQPPTPPLPAAMWSTYRFDPREYRGTVARLFASTIGEKGQGFTTGLDKHGTSLHTTVNPFPVTVKSVQWELRRAPARDQIEELAMVADEEPRCLEESLMGLLTASTFCFETPTSVYGLRPMSLDLPKGPTPWRGIADWRGGFEFGNLMFQIPAASQFCARVDIDGEWRPVHAVTLRITLEMG
jgi:hypothetical protein